MDTRHKREGFYLKILYALRTIIMYIYMFGYMLLYYPVLRRGENGAKRPWPPATGRRCAGR